MIKLLKNQKSFSSLKPSSKRWMQRHQNDPYVKKAIKVPLFKKITFRKILEVDQPSSYRKYMRDTSSSNRTRQSMTLVVPLGDGYRSQQISQILKKKILKFLE